MYQRQLDATAVTEKRQNSVDIFVNQTVAAALRIADAVRSVIVGIGNGPGRMRKDIGSRFIRRMAAVCSAAVLSMLPSAARADSASGKDRLSDGMALASPGVSDGASPGDPCGGSEGLLAILDRPTVGDSACVVPSSHIVLELGVQRTNYRDGSRGYNFPEAEFRVGIPGNNELVLLTPNYTRQRLGNSSVSGPSATVIGIKHELGYSGNWLGAVESLVTLPSGNATYGSRGTGVAVNGIVNYTPTDNTSLAMMMGVSSQTLARASGGARYASVNPDFVATWAPLKRVQLYAEVNGQSRASPNDSWGWNADGGIQYLVTPNVEIDSEVGYRLAGDLGGFQRYVGVGLGLKY